MYVMKSRHFFLLLFFMLSKAFAMKVNETCTTKAGTPISGDNLKWTNDELGTSQFSVDLYGDVQAVGSLRITKQGASDIPNAYYVYWDTPTWINGYYNDLFNPNVKSPPQWTGENPYTYTNPYNVVNVPPTLPIAVNMDLYTDCFTDQNTKELNCNMCNVFLLTSAPPASLVGPREKVDYSQPYLAKIFQQSGMTSSNGSQH